MYSGRVVEFVSTVKTVNHCVNYNHYRDGQIYVAELALESNPQKASCIHPHNENFDKELCSNGDYNLISLVVSLLNEDRTPAITDPTNNITKKVIVLALIMMGITITT